MDHDEMRQAFRRAFLDISTALDMVIDLQEERNALLVQERVLLDKVKELEAQVRQLEVERDGWIRQAIGHG